MTHSPDTTPAVSGRKLWAFRLGALLIPVSMLVILELGLRLGGYGAYPPLFTPIEGYEEYLQPHEGVAARYFTTIESIPGIPFDSFHRAKRDSSLRIVIQGGSTAAGFPFYFGGSFPDMLEQRLLMTFPGRQIEVVNTSMAAVNSFTLLDFADEIIEQEPDAVIIYAGHNEYYGALGVGSTQLLGRNPALIRLYLALKPFRSVQLLQAFIQKLIGLFGTSEPHGPQGATLMQNMVGEQRIPLGSELYEDGIEQFRSNMNRLLARYQRAGIPVLIGSIASNERDHAPFLSGVSDPSAMQSVRDDVQEAMRIQATGDTTAAISRLSTVLDGQPEYAAAWYARARLLDGRGEANAAARDYRQARLRDELRFRGPDAMNEVIQDLAAEHGATFVDTEAAIRAASPDGIPGRETMLEHLHPNIQGYFVLSDAFYDALARISPGKDVGYEWDQPISAKAARSNLLVTPIDSLVGMYRIQQLMASWPFKPAGSLSPGLDTLAAGTLVGDLSLRVYQRDITRLQALDQLQQAAARSGNARQALQSIFAIIQRYPFLPGPYLSAANIQMALRQYDEAEQYVLASLERAESAEGLRILGSLLLNRQQPEQAIIQLERAVQLAPSDAITRYNLAGAYALVGRMGEARIMGQAALDLAPENAEIQRFLASLPE